MGRILIKKVIYRGERYNFESPELKGGVTIIQGKNGNGKSTFMNLIYFGLSGKVEEFTSTSREPHDEIINDKNNCVQLDLLLNNKPYSFIRYISSNDITVLFEDKTAKVFAINRSKFEKTIFSDWILNELGIEPVDIFQGINTSTINFKDLLRLVYHNQELNPKKIYKPSDLDNFISDSELIRKVIFELLIGKTFSEYYSTLAKLKEKEKEKNIAKGILDDFIASVQQLSTDEDLNMVFLTKGKQEKEDQLSKLLVYRESLKDSHRPKNRFSKEISDIKSTILSSELSINEKNRSYAEVVNELSKLRQLRENVILEVTQITKIIHSHEKLSLFSADTCPYCLRDVNRTKGHCVCGNDVEEEQYERFFYNSDEYSDILKSKQKSIETIDLAIGSCQDQAGAIGKEIDSINEAIEEDQKKLTEWIQQYDFTSNTQEMKKVEDLVLSLRTEISEFTQKMAIENKRETLQSKYNTLNNQYETLRNTLKILDGQASADIKTKVEQFNAIYNGLMINTLTTCRSAAIGYDDYMPIIDGGIYKEASASVPIRMMYFFTLLKMSLNNSDVKFPRLLLIDTPETAGVDTANLKNAISQITSITDNHSSDEYQIILTTGEAKYPDQFVANVVLKLTDDSKLLRPVIQADNKSSGN